MAKLLDKIDYNSPVILTFALVSLAVLGLGALTDGWTTGALFCVYRSSPLDPAFYARLFGHVLGHADLAHYVNNMMVILLVGPMVEEKYGSKALLEMIAITALVTGIAHLLLADTALLGASGIAFMLIVLSSVTSVEEGKIPLTLVAVVVLFLGGQVVAGALSADNVSQLTHIVGGILGAVFGLVLGRRGGQAR